jgi:hypothetical protein
MGVAGAIDAASPGTIDVMFWGGFGTLGATSSLAAVTQVMSTTSLAFQPGTYNLFYNERCSTEHEGCTAGLNVFLGLDKLSVPLISRKYIIAHEMGHAAMWGSFGMLASSYDTQDSPPDMCSCKHVTVANSHHCLQSREFTTAAQAEGWAHALAARSFNNDSQNDCTFSYYKEWFTGVSTMSPPVTVDCTTKFTFTERFCPAADRGSELDWLNFYWQVGTKGADKFSWNDFRTLYLRACNDAGASTCLGFNMTWPRLRDAANAVWGAGSAKASYFINTAAAYGVDN